MAQNTEETAQQEPSLLSLSQNRIPSLTEPGLLNQELQQSYGSRLKVGSILKNWTSVSRINYLSIKHIERESVASSMNSLRRRSIGMPPKDLTLAHFVPCEMRDQAPEDIFLEQFPINVTSLMNEDNLWGCFYTCPELYADEYSPVVRLRQVSDVPELVSGVLTRDMISACLSYLRRIPILGDYFYIKLDLSSKHLVNLEVLQHYKYLVYLDLSTNYLTELTVLSHLLYLQFLSVSYNRLSTVLEYDVPQWFLTEVQYKYNSVKRIRDLTMFWSITILDLSHNNIKCISGLDNLHFLRRLDLSFNHIQRLENLNNLRLIWLDVSYNNISSFEFSQTVGLWTLYHLEYLNLNENNLTSMKVFSGCTRLQELHARNNRLSILLELAVYMRQLRRLTILDLRANPVCAAPGYKEVVVNTFPLLLSLDAHELDPIDQRHLKMSSFPDVNTFANRRLLRLLYIEQLSRARVSPFVPPADTTEVPLVILVGYEAVGKGSLARRLAKECSSNIELAVQHTTASFHFHNHYHEVSRSKFDDMLMTGDFLTYTEMDGESYGLSREGAEVKDGKVKLACMDLISALMVRQRGLQPYLILANCLEKETQKMRQQERKDARNRHIEGRTSIEVPIEKSTLQVLVSGRILVTGILNEILLILPDEKDQSEFLIESQCSLLMDSEVRQAIQEYAKGVNMLELVVSNTPSMDAGTKLKRQDENAGGSLCSLYKESQGADEYASDIGQNSSLNSKRLGTSERRSSNRPDRISNQSQKKSVDYSRTRMSGQGDSAKSSKSVTFTSQELMASATRQDDRGDAAQQGGNVARELTGLAIEAFNSDETKEAMTLDRSLSKKLQTMPMRPTSPGRKTSSCSFDDGDLWLSFLIDTGLLQASDLDVIHSDSVQQRHDTKVDDPDYILHQLAHYRSISRETPSTNIKDDYEDIHRTCPGIFWDTITMDDRDAAFKKAKRIIKDIVQSQKTLKPMFDINFAEMDCPIVQEKIDSILKTIAPQRFFF